MKRWILRLTMVALMCGLPAAAADDERDEERERPKGFGVHGWGLRFGVGDDPDQVIAGAQFDFGSFKWVHLEPNLELSIGDDRITLAGTYAVHYRFRYVEHFRPYAGAGLGLAVTHFDPPGGMDDTDLDIGLRAIGGLNWRIRNGREAFLEVALGLGFPYDAQIMAGWTF